MLTKCLKVEDPVRNLKQTFDILRKYQIKLNPENCALGVSSKKFLGFIVMKRDIKANSEKIKAILEIRSPQNVKEVQKLTGDTEQVASQVVRRV